MINRRSVIGEESGLCYRPFGRVIKLNGDNPTFLEMALSFSSQIPVEIFGSVFSSIAEAIEAVNVLTDTNIIRFAYELLSVQLAQSQQLQVFVTTLSKNISIMYLSKTDHFWGCEPCDTTTVPFMCTGSNILGRLWMKVINNFRRKAFDDLATTNLYHIFDYNESLENRSDNNELVLNELMQDEKFWFPSSF